MFRYLGPMPIGDRQFATLIISLSCADPAAAAPPQASDASGGPELAACCYVDQNAVLRCENTSFEDCLPREPVGLEDKWLQGESCGTAPCPMVTCLASDASCRHPHPTPGCNDYSCCENICREDEYCCTIEWDEQCVSYIAEGLCELPITNQECLNAVLLHIPADFKDAFPLASLSKSPGLCCYDGGPLVCLGGDVEGLTCQTDDDCNGGVCGERPPWVFGALWYKFVAVQTSVRISTCTSSAENATDSILQLFAAADHTSQYTACSTLMPIACSDNEPGCGFGGKLSRLCAEGLEIGRTYYLLAGGKSYETQGEYRITIASTPCSITSDVDNDWCHRAVVLPERLPEFPFMTFDLTEANAECGNDVCYPDSTADLWYEFTPECAGWANLDTCGAEGETTLEAYDGCDLCPPLLDSPIRCSNDQHCGPSGDDGRIDFAVAKDHCYKIRLATNSSAGEGILRATVSSDCLASYVDYVDPPAGIVDARRPYPPGNQEALAGIDRFLVDTNGGDCKHCWLLCDGAFFQGYNTVKENDRVGGFQEILLARPLSPWAITKIKHVPWGPPAAAFVVRPGDVDASGIVDAADAASLIGGLGATKELSIYSCDIDHSGHCTPLDLMDWIDGANTPAYDGYTWLNHPFAPEPFCD